MKRWIKPLSIGVVIATATLALLISLLPTLLKPTLNRWLPDILSSTGMGNGSIHIQYFSWHQLRVSELSLPLADGSLIALRNLTLDYQPGGLLRGHLDSLALQQLTVHLAGETGEQLAASAASGAGHAASSVIENTPEISIPAFQQWLRLPLQSLRIDTIELQHPSINARLSADVTPRLWRVWGDVQLDNIPLPWQLEMQLQDSGDVLLMLSESRQLLSQIHGHIRQDDAGNTHIELTQRLDIEAFSQRLLSDVSQHLPFRQLQANSTLVLAPTLQLPQGLDLSTTIKLHSQPTTVFSDPDSNSRIHWQSGTLALTLNKPAQQDFRIELHGQHQLEVVASNASGQAPFSALRVMLQGNDRDNPNATADIHPAGERRHTNAESKPMNHAQAAQPLLSAQCSATLDQCHYQGHLPWDIQGNQQSLQLALAASGQWQAQQGLTTTLELDIHGDQQHSDYPKAQLAAQGRAQFRLSADGDWQLSSREGVITDLRLQPFPLPASGSAPDPATTPPTLSVSPVTLALLRNSEVRSEQQQLKFEPLSIDLKPFTATLTQPGSEPTSPTQTLATLNIRDSQLQCRPDITAGARSQLTSRCELRFASDASSYQQWPIPDLQLSGPLTVALPLANEQGSPATINAQQPTLSADLDIQLASQQVKLRTHWQHYHQPQNPGRQTHDQQNRSSHGSLQWQLQDTPLSWSVLGLPDMAELTQIQLLAGRIGGQGWLDWQQDDHQQWQLKPDVMLRFDDLSATYDNSISVENWRGLFALRRPLDFSSGSPGDYLIDAQLSGDSVNSGVQLSDLLARSQTRVPADLSYALVEIYEMHTRVLGGRVHTPLIRFDSRKDINAFGIEVDNIQLSELAKLEAKAQIEASGSLDGVLPIVLTPAGPQIPGGTLFARDPGGNIRYNNDTSQALKSSDQTVGLAMQLLENFDYNQLQSGIEYQPDGALHLALQFQGHNPDFFDGQATHLNVNLDYNLLDLLESLRVTNDVVQKLEDKYQL